MDEDVQNRTNILSTAILPELGKTSLVKFGPVTLEISMWNPPKALFSEDHILVPRGCCTPKFLLASALPPGMGPAYIF